MSVEFQEGKNVYKVENEDTFLTGILIKSGIVKNKEQAAIFLLFIAIISIITTIFIIFNDNQSEVVELSDEQYKAILEEEGIYDY